MNNRPGDPSKVSVVRWLGDKSGLLTSLAPWTGAPGSHQRTWEEKDGGEAPTKAFISRSRFSYPWSESMRKKTIFNPGTLVRLGTRPGGKAQRPFRSLFSP